MTSARFVHIIDDNEAARDSLAFLLSTSDYSVAVYPSAPDFLSKLHAAAPGCVVTDVRMPEMSGLDLIARLKQEPSFAMPIIVMTGHGDIAMAVEAMKAGAIDFIEKPYNDAVMLAAVRNALTASSAAREKSAGRADAARRLATLSGRERDVLRGLVAGRANKVIAQDLGISPRTVEIYRAHVMTKMAASSLSELVRTALLLGDEFD